MSRHRASLVALLAGLTLLVTACGGAAPASSASTQKSSSGGSTSAATTAPSSSSSSATPKKALTPLHFLYGWIMEGYQAPFYLALENGYYKRAGLDVTLTLGKGSGNTAKQVGHGNYQMGFADAATTATAISKGVPAIVVAGVFQKSPLAVIFKQGTKISKPSDLVGKKIGTSAGSATDSMFNALLAANHLKRSQMTMENMSASAKVGALESGKVDAFLDYNIDTVPLLQARGMKTGTLMYADWGVSALSTSIIANKAFAKAHPAEVRAFIAATAKAWAAAQKNPQAAVAAEKKWGQANHQQMPPNLIGGEKLAFALLHTKNSQGHPVGWMSPKDWSATLDILHRYLGVQHLKAPSAYYTDQFIG